MDAAFVEELNKLIKMMENNSIDETELTEYKYSHMLGFLNICQNISSKEGGKALFVEYKKRLNNAQKKMISRKEKVRVGIIFERNIWCLDKLYDLLEQSDIFEPVIYPTGLLEFRDIEDRVNDYLKSVDFL